MGRGERTGMQERENTPSIAFRQLPPKDVVNQCLEFGEGADWLNADVIQGPFNGKAESHQGNNHGITSKNSGSQLWTRREGKGGGGGDAKPECRRGADWLIVDVSQGPANCRAGSHQGNTLVTASKVFKKIYIYFTALEELGGWE